ncbi:N-acetyl-gamma-glutamyl-phosphate reductase [Thermaurantiacus sp.]
MDRVRIAVLGASGYTGADLVRLALAHPGVEIAALGASQKAGAKMADIWPHFAAHRDLPPLCRTGEIDFGRVDIVFGCLPHGAGAAVLAELAAPRVIDLSADFRLKSAETYADWYGVPHPAPERLEAAVYGLTEFARPHLADARLVACPGCYPTAALLALLPLAEARAIEPADIAIFALSGVSGAGRSLRESNLFVEVAEAAAPYSVGRHRHMPEIEQELARAFGEPVAVSFTPHLLPMNRGELETIAVRLAPGARVDDLRQLLARRYADEPFVHLLPEGTPPATRMVRGSNHCVLNVFPDRRPSHALVIAAIDNLVKGSSGQALQNMNVMLGLPETLGLEAAPLFP